MNFLLILALFMSSFSNALENKGDRVRLLGRFIRFSKSDQRNPLPQYQLFFYVKDKEGKEYGYPVVIENEGLKDKIDTESTYFIDAKPIGQNLTLQEMPQTVTVFHLFDASPIELKSIGVDGQSFTPDLKDPNKKEYSRSPKAGVSDNLANTLIGIGAAGILGAILSK